MLFTGASCAAAYSASLGHNMAWPLSVLGHLVMILQGVFMLAIRIFGWLAGIFWNGFWLGRQEIDAFLMFYCLPHTLPMSFQWFKLDSNLLYLLLCLTAFREAHEKTQRWGPAAPSPPYKIAKRNEPFDRCFQDVSEQMLRTWIATICIL